MSEKKSSGLGRGLAALLDEAARPGAAKAQADSGSAIAASALTDLSSDFVFGGSIPFSTQSSSRSIVPSITRDRCTSCMSPALFVSRFSSPM